VKEFKKEMSRAIRRKLIEIERPPKVLSSGTNVLLI